MPAETGPEHPTHQLEGYHTLAKAVKGEIKAQRSRFVCQIVPVRTAAAAKAELVEMARLYHDARHICHASRLGPPAACQEARHDAGEPTGTAGEPILASLRQAGLTDCVAMVARYFGGVKLGTGGLARAYGEATAIALARATVNRVLLGFEFDLNFAYTYEKTLTRLLEECQGRKLEQNYAESVCWRVWLPQVHRETFVGRATDATAGEATIAGLVPSDQNGIG